MARGQVADNGNDQASEAENKKCRVDFEKEEGLTQQAITLRNASYLGDQRYRGTYDP